MCKHMCSDETEIIQLKEREVEFHIDYCMGSRWELDT